VVVKSINIDHLRVSAVRYKLQDTEASHFSLQDIWLLECFDGIELCNILQQDPQSRPIFQSLLETARFNVDQLIPGEVYHLIYSMVISSRLKFLGDLQVNLLASINFIFPFLLFLLIKKRNVL
jgi:hypothetical protein